MNWIAGTPGPCHDYAWYYVLPTGWTAAVHDSTQASAPRQTTEYHVSAICRHWIRQLPGTFKTLADAKNAALCWGMQQYDECTGTDYHYEATAVPPATPCATTATETDGARKQEYRKEGSMKALKPEDVKVGMVVKYRSIGVHYVRIASRPNKEEAVKLEGGPDTWAYCFELRPLTKREIGKKE